MTYGELFSSVRTKPAKDRAYELMAEYGHDAIAFEVDVEEVVELEVSAVALTWPSLSVA